MINDTFSTFQARSVISSSYNLKNSKMRTKVPRQIPRDRENLQMDQFDLKNKIFETQYANNLTKKHIQELMEEQHVLKQRLLYSEE